MEQQAFVLRVAPSGIQRVPEALDRNLNRPGFPGGSIF